MLVVEEMPAVKVGMDDLLRKHQFVKQAKVQELTCTVVGDENKFFIQIVNWKFGTTLNLAKCILFYHLVQVWDL